MVCFIPAEVSADCSKSLSMKPDQKGSLLGMEKPGGTSRGLSGTCTLCSLCKLELQPLLRAEGQLAVGEKRLNKMPNALRVKSEGRQELEESERESTVVPSGKGQLEDFSEKG